MVQAIISTWITGLIWPPWPNQKNIQGPQIYNKIIIQAIIGVYFSVKFSLCTTLDIILMYDIYTYNSGLHWTPDPKGKWFYDFNISVSYSNFGVP